VAYHLGSSAGAASSHEPTPVVVNSTSRARTSSGLSAVTAESTGGSISVTAGGCGTITVSVPRICPRYPGSQETTAGSSRSVRTSAIDPTASTP